MPVAIPSNLAELLDQAGGQALSQGFNNFLTTPTGQSMLRQIEDKAKSGVQEAASANAINLMVFALAGGAVGGTIFKGPIGILAASALAVWAGSRILANVQQKPQPVQGFGGFSDRASCAR
jgi:hypothetical protein